MIIRILDANVYYTFEKINEKKISKYSEKSFCFSTINVKFISMYEF